MQLVKDLERLGEVRILDLSQAATIRGIIQPWLHEGIFYLLPPEGTTSTELVKLFDAAHERGEIHFAYNAQSVMENNHKPILPMDAFANRYFSDPPHGLVKIVAVARNKVGELFDLIDSLKKPFSPTIFPHISELVLSEYKPPAEGHQTTLGLRTLEDDWKHVSKLEDDLKTFMAETNMIREISVVRHSVKGLAPEVVLISTESTTPKGNDFMVALANYLNERGDAPVVKAARTIEDAGPPPDHSVFMAPPRPKDAVATTDPFTLYRNAIETVVDTLKTMKGYEGVETTRSGPTTLVQFKAGFLGLGNPFDKTREETLKSVFRGVQAIPMFSKDWALYYHFDKTTKVLSLRAGSESERPPHGWSILV